MRTNASIAARLMLRLLLAFALGPVIAIGVLIAAGSGKPNLRIDELHERQADAAVALLQAGPGSELMLRPLAAEKMLQGVRLLVYGKDPSRPIATWPLDARISTWQLRVGYQTVRRLHGTYFRLLFPPGTGDWRNLMSWLRAELEAEDLPLLAALLAVAAPLAYLSVRGSLAPVRQLAREAAMIEPGQAQTRLSERDAPLELLPLVKAINASLDRVDAGFASQRRFAARVAHELRTPLAVISARLELPESEPRRTEILNDLRGMARLIEQLLTLSELSERRLRLDADVDLVATLREVIAKAAPMALRQGKHVELVAPESPVVVRGNAAAIATAARNLIENALRHSPPGGLVSAHVAPREPAIEIADEGPGIAAEDRVRVFEPFWRGGSASTGLGLSIVKEMAELHGGSVSVHQNHPHGAVFRIRFRPAGPAAEPVRTRLSA